MSTVNVDEIMNQIRAEIAQKGLKESDIKFEDIPMVNNDIFGDVYNYDEFSKSLDMARPHVAVNASPALHGNILSKIVKKILRRLIAYHIEAIVDEQNEYNKYTFNAVSMLPDKIDEYEMRIEALEKRISELEKKSN